MRRALLLAFLTLMPLVACGPDSPDSQGSGGLPEANELLLASAERMTELSSVGFVIDIDGELSNFQIQQAVGTLSSEGDVSASAKLYQGGRLVEIEYIRLDGVSYLKLPTGGFREVSSAVAASIFDPAMLLDAEQGIPAALTAATDARTQAREELEGEEAYRIVATLNSDLIEGLSMLADGRDQPFTLWIAADDSRLLRAIATFESSGNEQTQLTVSFSDFNEDVDIQAPQ